jgi:type I restriction enzyme R subunit
LYKLTVGLIRAYANLANELAEAGYTPEQAAKIKEEVKYYEHLRAEIKLASGDAIDLKAYEPAMRHLIDTYIGAEESEVISAFDDMTLIEMIVERGEDAVSALPESIRRNPEAMAETIENNIRKVIIDERPTNPKYFEKMSVLLKELVEQRKKESEDYAEHLKKLVELARKVKKPATHSDYPPAVNTAAKRALYDNLGQDENLAVMLDAQVKYTKKDNWRSHPLKRKAVQKAIEKVLPEELQNQADDIYRIIEEQKEY